MAAEGMTRRPGRPGGHHRRPAGDRPRGQDADRPGRRDHRRGPDLPRRRPHLQRLPGRRGARSTWTPTACASTGSRRRSTASRPRAGGSSSSTPCPRSRTPAGRRCRWSAGASWCGSPPSARSSSWRTTRTGCSATRATPLPPLYALDGGVYVMYLGTFSKILSPGIRLGWVSAPPPVLDKINVGKQGADLCTSTLSQLMVQAYFERGDWRDYVGSLTEVYRPRRDAMLDALEEFFPPQAVWNAPAGRHVRVGHAARLHRHHRPPGPGAARQRGVRARRRRLPRRPRRTTRCG